MQVPRSLHKSSEIQPALDVVPTGHPLPLLVAILSASSGLSSLSPAGKARLRGLLPPLVAPFGVWSAFEVACHPENCPPWLFSSLHSSLSRPFSSGGNFDLSFGEFSPPILWLPLHVDHPITF